MRQAEISQRQAVHLDMTSAADIGQDRRGDDRSNTHMAVCCRPRAAPMNDHDEKIALHQRDIPATCFGRQTGIDEQCFEMGPA